MNITKKDLARKISIETKLSTETSSNFVTSFFNIHKEVIRLRTLKISKFGSYNLKITPARMGRNPKSMEEYLIQEKKRVSFKASNHIKKILN